MKRSESLCSLGDLVELEVPVRVILCERRMSLADLVELRPGAVLEFLQPHTAPLALEVQGTRLGRGRAVTRDDRFGLLLDEVTELDAEPPGARPGGKNPGGKNPSGKSSGETTPGDKTAGNKPPGDTK